MWYKDVVFAWETLKARERPEKRALLYIGQTTFSIGSLAKDECLNDCGTGSYTSSALFSLDTWRSAATRMNASS